jgi:hypothetical protein
MKKKMDMTLEARKVLCDDDNRGFNWILIKNLESRIFVGI